MTMLVLTEVGQQENTKDGQIVISTGRSNGERHVVYLDGAQFDCLASPSLPDDQARACMLPWLKK